MPKEPRPHLGKWFVEIRYPDGQYVQGNFQQLGIESPVLTTGAGKVGQFTFRKPLLHSTTADLCPFGSAVILRDHNAKIRFQGRRIIAQGASSGPQEFQTYRFVDAWWDLEKRKLEQKWYLWHQTGGVGTYLKQQFWVPHVILNFNRSLASEIRTIIEYAADPAAHLAPDSPVAIQAGNITCRIDPANTATEIYAPTDEVTCRDIASVLKQLFALAPGNVPWLDYTTAPPSLHFQSANALPEVAVQLTDAESLSIEPRWEDTAPGVIIHYERTDQVTSDGKTKERPVFFTDAYPVGTTGREERAVAEVVQLAGFVSSTVSADLVVNAFPAALSNLTGFETLGALAFWKQKMFGLHLDDPRIDQSTLSIVPGSCAVSGAKSGDDEEAPAVHYELPNYLVAGQIADWMTGPDGEPLVWQNIVLTVQFNYVEFSEKELNGTYDPNKKKDGVKKHQVKIYIKSTNAPTGANTFTTEGAGEEGEQPPIGYAQFLYNQLKDVAYQGSVSFVQAECDGKITMGNVLNIGGGRPEWLAMRSLVQGVTEDLDTGKTDIQFGTAGVFNLGALITLDRVHRMRRRWTGMAQQGSGELT